MGYKRIYRDDLKLSGVEYLCLKMQSNPGKSKRYYLKQKNIYQHGSDPSNGANGMSGYFRPGCFYEKISGQIAQLIDQDKSQKEKTGWVELYISLDHVECI